MGLLEEKNGLEKKVLLKLYNYANMSTRLPKIFYELRQLAKIWHPFAEKVQQNEDDKKPLPHFGTAHVQKKISVKIRACWVYIL